LGEYGVNQLLVLRLPFFFFTGEMITSAYLSLPLCCCSF
jgi:hypothetical protein